MLSSSLATSSELGARGSFAYFPEYSRASWFTELLQPK